VISCYALIELKECLTGFSCSASTYPIEPATSTGWRLFYIEYRCQSQRAESRPARPALPDKRLSFEEDFMMRADLIDMLCRKSFQYSEAPTFKLVSGRMSRFYVNCKPTILSAAGMALVGPLVLECVRKAGVSAVGGLTFGADPIAVATAYASAATPTPIDAFSIRKTRKDHGMVRWIEGDIGSGARVAVIDDVATTGGSTITAIERARSEGLDVIMAVVLVDRQEGGLENIRKHVKDVEAMVNRDELVTRWKALQAE
jgi:orotate phosphoribosyltransferase